MTEWWFNDSKLVMNQKKYHQIFKCYMFYITERKQKTRPDAVAEKHKQNISLLFCDNYRGDKALAVWNFNNQGWVNFSRSTIILLIYKFTEWKFYLGFYYSRQQKYTRLVSSKSSVVWLEKKITPRLLKSQRHIISLWTLNKGPFALQRLKLAFERLVIRSLHQVKFISWLNDFNFWSSQFYNTNYTVTTRINFGNSNQWPIRSRNVFLLQND